MLSTELERILTYGDASPPKFGVAQLRCETVWVAMRDGTRLATDLYLPPSLKAPAVLMRTPYARANDRSVANFMYLARRGYVVASQDCRGTGDSEPDSWDYYMYEPEDGYDFVDWIARQSWFDGFAGSLGGSYNGQTQWCMAMHPKMSTVVPQVSGLGIAVNTAHLYMFLNAYARSIGKGADKVEVHYTQMERLMADETMAGGYFNEPLHRPVPEALLERYPRLRNMSPSQAACFLWDSYCNLSCAKRAAFVKEALSAPSVTIVEVESLPSVFGQRISHDAHTLPHPRPAQLCQQLQAPALMITGWYDWGLNDALATWELFTREAHERVSSRSRLIIAPSAHGAPGYREGIADHPELQHDHRSNVSLLSHWYEAVRAGTTPSWPRVTYYLMGANEWRTASAWPVPEASEVALYLGEGGTLADQAPASSTPESYTYDPCDPTPTMGGSIVSYLYTPGSVEVSEVQKRSDVLVYSTPPLKQDLDVVGPLRMVLYAASSALDTDFVARLSDVFPDGRAIQLQSGILRARYRIVDEPQLLEPGRVYRFDIDLWATANRFKAGHCVRIDISSADFPHYDRNSNKGGHPGEPVIARQTIYHDSRYPSHLLMSVVGGRSYESSIPPVVVRLSDFVCSKGG